MSDIAGGMRTDTMTGNFIADRNIALAEWAGKWLAHNALPDALREPLQKLQNDQSFQSEFIKSVFRAGAMSLVDAPKFLVERLGVSPEKVAAAEGLVNDFVNHTLRKLMEHAGDKPAHKGVSMTASIPSVPAANESSATYAAGMLVALAYRASDTGPMLSHYHAYQTCPRMQRELGYRWYEVVTETKPQNKQGRGNNNQQQQQPQTTEVKTQMKPVVTTVLVRDAARDMDSTGAKACHACGADELIRKHIAGQLEAPKSSPAPEGSERGAEESFRAFFFRIAAKAHASLPFGKGEAFSGEVEAFLRTPTGPSELSPLEILEQYVKYTGGFTVEDAKLLFELPAEPHKPELTDASVLAKWEALYAEAKASYVSNPDKLTELVSCVGAAQETSEKRREWQAFLSEMQFTSVAQVVAILVDMPGAASARLVTSLALVRESKHAAALAVYQSSKVEWEMSRNALRMSRNKLLTDAVTALHKREQERSAKEHAEHAETKARLEKEKEAAVKAAQEFGRKHLGLTEAESGGDFSQTKSALPWG